MANLVGQLTYFYTDKVGAAVGGVGFALMIAKILDALTDVLVGNMVDHSKMCIRDSKEVEVWL